MKLSSKTCIVLFLLAASVLTENLTPTCAPATDVFLKYLNTLQTGAAVDTAVSKPNSGWTVCEVSWGTGKTCCDATNLKLAFKKEADKAKTAWNSFAIGIKKFKDAATKLKTAAGTVASATTAAKANFAGLSDSQGQAMVDKLGTINAEIDAFKMKASDCFKATNKARSNLFCEGCTNLAFFTQAQTSDPLKFTFKTETCNAVVAACVPVWSFILNLQGALTVAHAVRRGGGATAPAGIPKFAGSTTYGQVATLLGKCPTGAVYAADCTQANLDSICAAFFNIKLAEPIVKAPEDTDITAASPATTARILQTGSEDGTGAADADATKGVVLNAANTMILEDATIDVSAVEGTPVPTGGNNTSTGANNTSTGANNTTTTASEKKSGNILMMSIVGLVSAFVSLTSF